MIPSKKRRGFMMARLTKEEEEEKINILDEISNELKEKSTSKRNFYTANNLLELANERFKLEVITQISPNSLKGEKPAQYLEKYSAEIKTFKKDIKENKSKYNEHLYNRLDDLEQQVENLILELVRYKDNYMQLERKYEKSQENYEYQKSKKNQLLKKLEALEKKSDED